MAQNWNIQDSVSGYLPIDQIDAGAANANGSTVYPTPPNLLGKVVRAYSATYGTGEFILLAGVASTVVGSFVNYNTSSYTTTLNPNTANLAQPVAVAMSANAAATTFGWYQIGGVAVIKKTGVKVSPNVAMFQSATAGRVMPTVATGKEILGARSANAATIASTTSTVQVMLDRPHMQGQVI
jgi:hypothetical protein